MVTCSYDYLTDDSFDDVESEILPHLHKLKTIHFSEMINEEVTFILMELFGTKPSLNSLRLYPDHVYDQVSDLIVMRYPNLKVLELRYPFSELFLNVVPKLLKLVTLEVSNFSHNEDCTK